MSSSETGSPVCDQPTAPPDSADALLSPWTGPAGGVLPWDKVTPSALGAIHLAWDFIELPSLLHERWLSDSELLWRFARHFQTGEPVPAALLDSLEAIVKHERIFSVNLDYLRGAFVVGLHVYLWADVLAVNVADAFPAAPDGLYDVQTVRRWSETILSVGSRVPSESAFRYFRGRNPNPLALLRRFDPVTGPAAGAASP